MSTSPAEMASILVVDDEEDIRLMINEVLTEAGHRVFLAGDVSEAKQHFRDHPIDLALTDLRLPGADGLDLAEWIKAMSPSTDVIVMTGFATVESATAAARLRVLDFLTKPFHDINLVAAGVRRALRKRRVERELRETSEELKQSRASFASIVELSADAIVIVDQRGSIRYANPSAELMFGAQRDQLVDSSFAFKLDPVEAAEIEIPSTRGERIAEQRVRSIVWSGENMSLVLLRDITERRHTEERLQEINRRLHEVAVAKDLFIAKMSHELKTPLNAILGYVSLLADGIGGAVTPKQSRWLAAINDQSEILLGVINDILTFSQLGASKLSITPQPVDVGDVVGEIARAARVLVNQRPVSVGAQVQPRLELITDPTRLKQLLLNLVTNAIKFTEAGEVAIHAAEDRDGIRFSVKDTGIGIAADQLGRIFEPFEQLVDPSRARPTLGGAGLGLSIVQGLLQLLGGDIQVESEVGKGSTFSFWLPRHYRAQRTEECTSNV